MYYISGIQADEASSGTLVLSILLYRVNLRNYSDELTDTFCIGQSVVYQRSVYHLALTKSLYSHTLCPCATTGLTQLLAICLSPRGRNHKYMR